jgi:hypothetical protein
MPRGNPYDRKITPPKKAPAEKQSAFEWLRNRPRTSFQGPTAFESVSEIKKPKAPAKSPARGATTSRPTASTAAPAPRMAAAERMANATRKEPPAPKTAPKPKQPKVTVSEARPAYTDVSAPPRTPRNFGMSEGKKSSYPVYDKKSDEAKSFRSAFSAARKGGAKTFMWEGRKYTTDVK